jgi:branched-chain amino acid transport system permease protein
MTTISGNVSSTRAGIGRFFSKVWQPYRYTPLISWLLGGLAAVIVERLVGLPFARALGMYKIPALFGILFFLDKPMLIPSALFYNLVVYILPIGFIARLSTSLGNRLAARLLALPHWISIIIHLGFLYSIMHVWADISDYRLLVARLILVAIIITLSLNVINGYMGEFSCSHPGFIALGAYAASAFTVVLFVDDNLFGPALLPSSIGIFFFPISLILGGLVAAVGAVFIAIPSFRTRGDYLAIVSLAFMFIIKSLFENLELLGGPRGMGSQPNWANLPTVFIWTVLSIWIINNFVRSTLGKALNAVRDDEIAASAMTVDTRRTKMTAFLFGAFWAGVAGGLFAHVIRYVNPGTFGLTMLAEVLAMVYFGGLNSVIGSIVGAVSINLLSEALRPLEIYKWIVIPLVLILVMVYRPTGLISFREFDVEEMIKPKQKPEE